jgi:hypothetical protein
MHLTLQTGSTQQFAMNGKPLNGYGFRISAAICLLYNEEP